MSDPKVTTIDFLKRNGYPFEMKVAKEFQKVGLSVAQSFVYTDSNTQLSREIDVIALYRGVTAEQIVYDVWFIIECKYAKTPWVLFSSQTNRFMSSSLYSYNDDGKRWLEHLACKDEFNNFFVLDKNEGYGLTATSGKDEEKNREPNRNSGYDAIQKILSFLKSESAIALSPVGFAMFVPIIAMRGKLFKSKLDEDDEIDCEEIDEAQLYYKESINGVTPKIHIITENKLQSYVKFLRVECDKLIKAPFLNPTLRYKSFAEKMNEEYATKTWLPRTLSKG